ncbi:hypothetical protein K2173_016923 [Erythroxylum novogranatense]|uniref:Large ribosomal subunit protein eL14 domain-containing protein n=1 Tax=Erythroxylum novogranatense TaxID=1862640 RepID=A0AAV8U586_9ROSI|nr:hypothetical protein K2173_016923 [Erythroxylum novogranatense]
MYVYNLLVSHQILVLFCRVSVVLRSNLFRFLILLLQLELRKLDRYTKYLKWDLNSFVSVHAFHGKVIIFCFLFFIWGPVNELDMERSQMNLKRLSLTDIKIDIKRVPKKKNLIEAMEKADVKNKWENSSWGRKLIVRKRRATLNDFDRLKLMLAKIKRGGLIRQELAKLKKETAA